MVEYFTVILNEEIQYVAAGIHSQLHLFELTSRFCAAKSFLVFPQKKRGNNLKTVSCSCLTVKWNRTKILSTLCISYTTITVPEYILRSFFCKYPMQLHRKQNAGMLGMYMCFNNHSFKEGEGLVGRYSKDTLIFLLY